jgi:hypothetical protein
MNKKYKKRILKMRNKMMNIAIMMKKMLKKIKKVVIIILAHQIQTQKKIKDF